jgi:ABC-type sugar transport system permease subunit
MVNNRDLSRMLMSYNNTQQVNSPVYIAANMDGLTFQKITAPQYKKFLQSKRV